MDNWTRVLLYGTFDGFSWTTDGDNNILLVLDNGDKVEIPNHFVKNASDFVEKNKIKLKDIIARIKKLDLGTQKVWLNEILNELGSDFGLWKYKAGYEQGSFDGAVERAGTMIPQIAADYIKYAKTTEWDLQEAMKNVSYEDNAEIRKWFYKGSNVEVFARAWLDGYTVEKEKRYEVILCNGQSLKTVYRQGNDRLDFEKVYGDLERFTRKQLEEDGFGWVFDCEGIEIEEVENE
ncbi:DUF1642 domain-containing protein [Streptococcus parasanguinis]|uniref:DUF1642 domain-containing protein n=1 Tax=Streptococcus parasanguinis TaxID=1318 RepID=UPI0020C83429|nr:DUF1642 domain-containing protein [Streptococcus parasanguinis]MCP8990056.1 DUF1642 domain-containing protein [Streptococcus parasanguinis]MCP8991752.1 DUF1642 domain-containing protein [Streptococcus parasanguinis]MCP9002841.1 DUF1642 domain-containing protein [Streptococcus parasanguinis]MCP9009105.1 DUF1642 domain-containing protein [Streptococcus parasanguinis]MCP9034787.1 DUF1642 domain-containing protein [Streptococcus parasanguinis]